MVNTLFSKTCGYKNVKTWGTKFLDWLYVVTHVMDYCNKYALCEAEELKALK